MNLVGQSIRPGNVFSWAINDPKWVSFLQHVDTLFLVPGGVISMDAVSR
jgi:hypothetical protein